MASTRGVKERNWLEFKYRATGEPIRFPVGTINGVEDGPTLVVLGGMHGSEFSGIEAAIRLFNEVKPTELKGTLIVGTIYNLPAFMNNLGFVVPHDGKNPLSTFPGSPIGTYGEAMAYYFNQEVLSKADYYVELHGGDIPEALTPFVIAPRTGNVQVDEKIAAMTKAYDVPFILKSPMDDPSNPPHSAYGVTATRGKPAFLAESGQQGILKLEETEVHLSGLRNILIYLGMMPGTVKQTVQPTYLDGYTVVQCDMDGMWYPTISLNDVVKQGQALGDIRDYFGQHLATITAPSEGVVTAIRTSPAILVGNVLVEYGHIEKNAS
jgi:predicted deacylase